MWLHCEYNRSIGRSGFGLSYSYSLYLSLERTKFRQNVTRL